MGQATNIVVVESRVLCRLVQTLQCGPGGVKEEGKKGSKVGLWVGGRKGKAEHVIVL